MSLALNYVHFGMFIQFLKQESIGSGGMSLALNDVHFGMFIQFLKQESKGEVSKKKAVVNIGRQPGGKVTRREGLGRGKGCSH